MESAIPQDGRMLVKLAFAWRRAGGPCFFAAGPPRRLREHWPARFVYARSHRNAGRAEVALGHLTHLFCVSVEAALAAPSGRQAGGLRKVEERNRAILREIQCALGEVEPVIME